MNTTVVGLQYGDCGKGRVVGYFSKDYDWAIRFNGGGNAGHTVYDEKGREFKLHHIPCGVVFGKKVALDSGMVINMRTLREELDVLEAAGFKPEIYISDNVHLITEYHLESDANGSNMGSTKRGIAYVYSDRVLRSGVRIGSAGNRKFSRDTKLVMADRRSDFISYRGLPPIEDGESAIFEGAQGIMLDVDYGCYPYVTSSSIMPSSVHRIDKFIGVMKAYTTRVGDGPPYWPDMEELRVHGKEYGTTTGRPRRCTWNDVDQIDYAISIVQPDEIVVTKLDVLDNLQEPICVYRNSELYSVGDLDSYKNFLLETFPKIKWFSESPSGDLIKVG